MQQDYTDSQIQVMNDSRDLYQEAEDTYAKGKALKDKADKLMESIKGKSVASKEVQAIVMDATISYQSSRLLFDKVSRFYEEIAKSA